VLAIALRDGQPPPRTPDSDPTLAAHPLTLVLGKQVATRHSNVIGTSAKRALITDTGEDHASLIAVDLATGTTKELFRTPQMLEDGVCDDAAEHCLFPEIHSKDRHVFSSDDPAKLFVLDGDKVSPITIPGTGESPSVRAVSPGGRFLIADGERAATVIFDRKTGKALPPDATHEYRSIIGWRDETVALVSIENTEMKQPERYGAWHLDTGVVDKLPKPALRASATSPDGSRSVQIGDGKVVVTPKSGAPRTLQLDAHDERFAEADCCQWLDNRYLSFPAARFGVIDTDAMKVAFVAAPGANEGEDDQHVTPIAHMMQAFVTKGDGMFLAKIVP
jgi:hypothetical protein